MDPEPIQSILASTPEGLTTFQVVILSSLPLLIAGSAFFSGSETALFGLTAGERMEMRRQQSPGSRAALSLLQKPRILLILLLLGNMTMNVLYFVASSVLMMNDLFGWFGDIVFAITILLAIVLLGEIVPKFMASAFRTRFARTTSPALFAMQRALLPLWQGIDRFVVSPLNRLTAPSQKPEGLSGEELQALVELSGREGTLDANEQQQLRDVLRLGKTTVRRVMTPRTRMKTIPIDASHDEVRRIVEETHLARLPVHGESLDVITGILHVKNYLQHALRQTPSIEAAMVPPRFVPEVTTLDRLLEHFQNSKTQQAVVVDEYGGTAGIISLQDVVEELVGDIADGSVHEHQPPRSVGPNQWIVDGNTSSKAWSQTFRGTMGVLPAATIGGLVTRLLGRAPKTGDVVHLANLRLEVHHAQEDHVVTVLVTIDDDGGEGGPA